MSPTTYSSVRLTDVLDPLTGARADLEFDVPGVSGAIAGTLDGAHLWQLPALYDADAHLPVLQLGLREQDRWRALAGGAAAINSAVPWHLIADLDLDAVTEFFAATSFPRVLPILSVADEPSSEGFAAWLDKYGEQIRTTWMPTIKLYSNDPYFRQNLEAIWQAGCRAAIYFYDDEAFQAVAGESGGPVHFRHITSQDMYEQVTARPDSTCQTSPHFLVQLPESRPADLFVLPPVPGGAARESLRGVVSAIDLIASDHNAPVRGNTGPGLESEQHLLSALLTLVGEGVLDLPTALAKSGPAAAAVFRPVTEIPQALVVVDPASGPVQLWPGQEARRAPYRGLDMAGTVLAVAEAGRGFFL
ncbi:MAG: hypothetical protein ABWY93_06955 [Mycobacterium sp.]